MVMEAGHDPASSGPRRFTQPKQQRSLCIIRPIRVQDRKAGADAFTPPLGPGASRGEREIGNGEVRQAARHIEQVEANASSPATKSREFEADEEAVRPAASAS